MSSTKCAFFTLRSWRADSHPSGSLPADRGCNEALPSTCENCRMYVSSSSVRTLPWKDTCAMFTGIVEHVGSIASLEKVAGGGRLRVAAGALAAGLAISGSIAVNGCCLTVVEIAGDTFTADLSSETLRRTGFGEMKPGAQVNLERPLTAGKELGGHFVQGHVDGTGRVARLSQDGPNWWLGV